MEAHELAPKPSRTYSKRSTAISIALAWAAVFAAMWQGPAMAAIVVIPMLGLIAALLGVYQAVGHLDLRALAALGRRDEARPEARSRARGARGGLE